MPTWEDNSQNHADQGMTEADITACQEVARLRNEIIMFRSTGCWSRPHIAAGHPTKPFHVKGKSSTWGPHAGFVPVDSEYSKAVSEADIAKGRKLNKEAIDGKWARPAYLFVTEEYITKHLLVPKGLTHRPAVDRITAGKDREFIDFYCTKPDENDSRENGKLYIFRGFRVGDKWQIFCFHKQDYSRPEPLQVLAVPGSDLPITGDYDLFAVCPYWKDYGSKDKKMDPTLDDRAQNRSMRRLRQKVHVGHEISAWFGINWGPMASIATIESYKTPEDPDRGNITARIFEVIVALNAQMGAAYGAGMQMGQPNVYQGGVVNQRVHHNAESGRPFAPGAEDGFPLTTFHPGPVGPYGFLNATIEELGDLRAYFETLYANGYYPPRNPAWQMPNLNQFFRDEFKQQLADVLGRRPR
jgi:hypothetical protein